MIDAADERVHAGPVLVMHLCVLAALSERVRLINQQDHAAGRAGAIALQLRSRLECQVERGRDQSCHFADLAATAGGQTKRIERNGYVFLPRDCVPDRFGELGLTRSHITRENDKRRAALDIVEQNLRIRMKSLRPGTRPRRIDQNAQHLGQTLLGLFDAD